MSKERMMSKGLEQVLKGLPEMTYLEFKSLGEYLEFAVASWLEEEDSDTSDFDSDYFCSSIIEWAVNQGENNE